MHTTNLSIHYNAGDCQQYDSNGHMVDFASVPHRGNGKLGTKRYFTSALR